VSAVQNCVENSAIGKMKLQRVWQGLETRLLKSLDRWVLLGFSARLQEVVVETESAVSCL